MIRYIIILVLIWILPLPMKAQTLSLDSCKIYALENNKILKEAQLKLDASKEVKKNAFTNYFPEVSAGAIAMKSSKSFIEFEMPEMNLPVYDGIPANIATATQFAYFPGMTLKLLDYVNTAYITAAQPVYAGGRISNGFKLASLGEEFSEHKLNLTLEEVLIKTEEYYWTIVALQEKQKTLNSYEELLNNLKKDVSVSYEAGLIQKSDLLKVQLELNSIVANKLKLENGISLLKMTLGQHIGIKNVNNFSIADTLIETDTPSTLYRNPQEALLNRNEYQMLNKAVDAEVLQKKIALGEYMPQLAIGVQGLYLDWLDQQNTYGLAFATLSVPVSGWWGGSHKIQEHKIKVDIAQNNLEEKSELLLLQIDKLYKDLNESFMQIFVAKSSNEQAQEHLKIVQDNYDAGIISTSDLLEAQAMFQQSEDGLVDAKTIFKIKKAYYLQAIAQYK